jgi:hypothetical protein
VLVKKGKREGRENLLFFETEIYMTRSIMWDEEFYKTLTIINRLRPNKVSYLSNVSPFVIGESVKHRLLREKERQLTFKTYPYVCNKISFISIAFRSRCRSNSGKFYVGGNFSLKSIRPF